MNASILPFVLVRQGSFLKKLIRQGAVDPDSAVTAAAAEVPDNAFARKLQRQQLILKTDDGKLYANIQKLSRNPIWRRYIAKHRAR